MARELSDQQLRWQAHKLRAFLAGCGDAERWFESKDFTREDEQRVRHFWKHDLPDRPEWSYFD